MVPHMFKHKEMYRTFFPLLLAISMQSLLSLAVNLVDNLMLGTYSEVDLSGAALVNQIHYVLQQLVSGMGAGAAVLGAQYWGKREPGPIRSIITISMTVSLVAGVLFFGVTFFFPEHSLRVFCDDQPTIEAGMRYLSLMCWTYIIYSVSASLMFSLRAVQIAWIGTIMSVSTIFINACLNYCLIYGNFGAPELGIYGAAIATLVSRLMELVLILGYVLLVDKKLQMKPIHLIRFESAYLLDFIRVAIPLMIGGAMWGIAQAAQTAILGHIGQTAIAANSIAVLLFQLFSVFGMSCAQAASVVIGNTIGAGEMDKIKPYTRSLQCIFIILGVSSSLLLLLFRDAIVSIYDITEETRQLTVAFINVLCISSIGSCYEYPVEAGIIAGGGNTKYAAIVDNLFMWLFTIPFAALSAFVFQFSPVVTFIFLKADQLLKCIPNAIVCNRYRWVKDLTSDHKRTYQK